MKLVISGFLCMLMIQSVYADVVSHVLWDKLSHIHAMTASFSQCMYVNKREISQSFGTMVFVRPNQFRWATKKPMEQLLIADGKKIWMYDVDLEQVTVKQQTASMGAAVGLFLSDDKSRFLHDFDVKSDIRDTIEVFQLQAHAKQANIQRITLSFQGEYLVSMELYDQLGQHTVIRFSKIEINKKLSQSLFQFIPPKDVDVVEQ